MPISSSLGVCVPARGYGGAGYIAIYYQSDKKPHQEPKPQKKLAKPTPMHRVSSQESFLDGMIHDIDQEPQLKQDLDKTLQVSQKSSTSIFRPLGKTLGDTFTCPTYLLIVIKHWKRTLLLTTTYTIIRFTGLAPTECIETNRSIPKNIPSSTDVLIDYYHQAGKEATEQKQYDKAIAYHNKAIALSDK